jgi:hypothetical protein
MFENESDERYYDPFLTNRSLSYFPDTILYANEMNSRHFLEKRLQYDYLFHGTGKRKRFSKWAIRNSDESVGFLVKLYECSISKANDIAVVLGEDKVRMLMNEYPEYQSQ